MRPTTRLIGEPHRVEQLARTLPHRRRPATVEHRHDLELLERRERREKVRLLEDDPHVRAPHRGPRRLVEPDVTLSFMDDEVALDVVDDGSGFDADAVLARGAGADSGFGLPGMRARARSLGGVLTVESTPGLGTAVAVRVPVDSSAREGGAW